MLLMKCFGLIYGGGMFHPGNRATGGGFDIVFSMYICSLYTCCAAYVNFSIFILSCLNSLAASYSRLSIGFLCP